MEEIGTLLVAFNVLLFCLIPFFIAIKYLKDGKENTENKTKAKG
ncbi:hypothetical protein [Helicobacter pullorum]|nr:hypothetical protein [Helicobacter pullorum]